MGQRLGIASALIGDPHTLILDEPVNGLDPEGIHWIRTLLKRLAAEGRTIFVSSHLMSEMAQTAERVIVIGRGQIIADTTMTAFIRSASSGRVKVRTPDSTRLTDLLRNDEFDVVVEDDGSIEVRGTTSEQVGVIAASAGIVLHELTPVEASLEEAFMTMTRESVEFHAGDREVAAL